MKKKWTEEEDKYMRQHFPDVQTIEIAKYLGRGYSSVACRASFLGLKKSQAFKSNPMLNGHINLVIHGSKHRFQKGQTPFNKGRKQTEYMSEESIEQTKATRFSKGNLPHNTLHDGAISIRKDNSGYKYKYIRVSKGNWQLLHRVNWEAVHGKIPKGMNIQFKDGNQLNCNIENLELVAKAQNMERNTIHRYPEDVKKAIRSISKLNKTIRHASK